MGPVPVLAREDLRVARMRSYRAIDQPPIDAVDSITRVVALVCETPIAVVTMLGDALNHVVSGVGIQATSAPRDTSFCIHALANPDAPLVVPDTLLDPRFVSNPVVTGPPFVRFYAGSPLVSPDGFPLGVLCVYDVRPRELGEQTVTMLRLASRSVMAILEERRTSFRLEETIADLRASAARLALLESAAVNAHEGVLVLERPAHPGDVPRVVFLNASVTRFTGWAPTELPQAIDTKMWAAFADRDGIAALGAVLAREPPAPYATESLVRGEDGRAALLRVNLSPLLDPDGGPTHWVVHMSDVSDRTRADAVELHAESILARNGELAAEIERRRDVERRLTFAAAHDSLTDLPNRKFFVDRLRARFSTARTHERDLPFAVMFLDIDRFKTVNDTLGHLYGDRLLSAVARRLQQCVRARDVVARLGGDEFTILVDAASDRRSLGELAERIRRAIATPFRLESSDVNVSASIGIVLDDGSHANAEDVLRDADIAMFAAKSGGRNRHEFFREELRDRVVGEARLEKALRVALDRDEFRLAYQPIVSLASGARRICGFEALLRWESHYQREIGTRGIVAAAQENGLIVPIGAWAIAQACRQLASWHAMLPADAELPFVTVNVSPRQLLEIDFAANVERAIGAAGLAPADLALELTESAIMHEADVVVETLARLRALGVAIYLDDFGTGFASLSYLRRFAIDWLKIDRSFVGGASSGLADAEIVDGIISLAHRLGIKTIAEGVETAEQMESLVALGCERAQGYAFGPPAEPSLAFESLERERVRAGAVD